MPFPDLSPLPVWAQVLVYSTFGISLAIVIGLARFGIVHGKKSAESDPGKAEVAAVIVDSTALNKVTGAVDGLTVAITGLTVSARELAANHKAVSEEVDNLREELRIHREVSRR